MNSCQHIKKKKGANRCCATTQENNPSEMNETFDEQIFPAVDIIENGNEFLILADMPGASEESIDVGFNAGELTISGEVEADHDEEDVLFRCRQFTPGEYFRAFRIGESIDADRISADYNDGVLTVHLPKKEELEPRKITVNKK